MIAHHHFRQPGLACADQNLGTGTTQQHVLQPLVLQLSLGRVDTRPKPFSIIYASSQTRGLVAYVEGGVWAAYLHR